MAMTDQDTVAAIVDVFARIGFKKASMGDIAEAAGVSRQTLYARFGSKEAIRDWAAVEFANDIVKRTVIELNVETTSAERCLKNAFARKSGDLVGFLKNAPFGSELVDMGMDAVRESKSNPDVVFEMALIRFLKDRLGLTAKEAKEIAFVLITSSKGLMVTCQNGEEFDAAMSRIIKAAVPFA